MTTRLSSDALAMLCEVHKAHNPGNNRLSVKNALALEAISNSIPEPQSEQVAEVVRSGVSYLVGMLTQRPYTSQNLGMGWLACRVFLRLNGFQLATAPLDAALMLRRFNTADISTDDFSLWLQSVSLKAEVVTPPHEA